MIPPLPESLSLAIGPSPQGALPECCPSQGRSSCEGRSHILPSSTPLEAGPVLDTARDHAGSLAEGIGQVRFSVGSGHLPWS